MADKYEFAEDDDVDQDEDTDDATAFDNYDLRAKHPLAETDEAVHYVFDFPELLQSFRDHDEDAGRARNLNRRVGWCAIGLVWSALMIGAFDLIHPSSDDISFWLHMAILALSVLGTGFGVSGLFKWSWRRQWLRNRLWTEMLRLFHFHYIAANLDKILTAKTEEDRQAYRDHRHRAFETFKTKVLENPEAEIGRIIERRGETDLSKVVPLRDVSGDPNPDVTATFFTVWQALRFKWQLGYANAKLNEDSVKINPRGLVQRFSNLGWVCLILILILHMLHFVELPDCIPKDLPALLIVWLAITALAGRALEEGRQPNREVERYEGYRASIRAARSRFRRVPNLRAKLGVAISFERTSMEEMRVFIRTHAEAKFLL